MKKLITKIKKAFLKFNNLTKTSPFATLKKDQKNVFEELKNDFKDHYQLIRKNGLERFTTGLWADFYSNLEKSLLPFPKLSFLNDPTIKSTMFLPYRPRVQNPELNFLENKFAKNELKKALEEEYVGGPEISSQSYLTSPNTIHNLYHLAKFMENSTVDLIKVRSVIEWGGGYGNFARIYQKLNLPHTYIIIDLPLLSCLQWLYLSSVLGKNKVNLITDKNRQITENGINLLPISYLEDYEIQGDVFISTWGLSESSSYALGYVVNKKWFGAKHLLLAYQSKNEKLPEAEIVGERALQSGAKILKIKHLPGNYYAFL